MSSDKEEFFNTENLDFSQFSEFWAQAQEITDVADYFRKAEEIVVKADLFDFAVKKTVQAEKCEEVAEFYKLVTSGNLDKGDFYGALAGYNER
jgi:hypothetical protein